MKQGFLRTMRAQIGVLALCSCLVGHNGWAAVANATQTDELDEMDEEPGYSSLGVTAAPGTRELQGALQRLAYNSGDLDALIDAGNAAILLGDPQAAIGFFARAEDMDPRNSRIKAGLASALLGSENPYEALRLFEEAKALGAPDSMIAADRGLAYDLVGNNDAAQQDYLLAMRREPSDETIRRYALSLGISGKRREAEAQLDALLRRGDSAAWRTRAFVLAISGDTKGAIDIANATMPGNLSQSMEPYLEYMPRLTASQQAAAAHFGHFPQSAMIGMEDPRNRAYAAAGRINRSGRADAGLIPIGEPLGQTSSEDAGLAMRAKADKKKRRRPGRGTESDAAAATSTAAASAAPPPASAPPPSPPLPSPPVAAAISSSRPSVASSQGANSAAMEAVQAAQPGFETLPPPVAVASAATGSPPASKAADNSGSAMSGGASSANPPPVVRSANAAYGSASPSGSLQGQGQSLGGFDLASLPATQASTAPSGSGGSVPAAATETPSAEKPAGLSTVIASLDVPPEELARDEDAVDLSKITPAKPPPPPPPKKADPPKPAHPSRHWVQVAGGANRDTLGREWKRVADIAPAAFKGKKGWWTPLNATNRVLAGPFENVGAAQDFVNQLAKSDIAAFTFTSAEGQVITELKR